MLNLNTLLFVSVAVFSIAMIVPMAMPLLENLMNSMQFMPRRY